MALGSQGLGFSTRLGQRTDFSRKNLSVHLHRAELTATNEKASQQLPLAFSEWFDLFLIPHIVRTMQGDAWSGFFVSEHPILAWLF